MYMDKDIRTNDEQNKTGTTLHTGNPTWQKHVTELQVISWLIRLLYYMAALRLLEHSIKTNPCLVENCAFLLIKKKAKKQNINYAVT